jgi:iron complex transport system ATP-binding protein
MNALSVVMTGATATIETMMRWTASAHDVERAEQLIDVMGVAHVTDGSWQTLSQGERGRVLIARALMARPRLLLLDEPSTGLDVAAREHLLARISALAGADESLTTVTITHHLEELPTSTTHAALIAGGRIIAAGSAVSSLTTENVSTAFKYPVDVAYTRGRWSATSRS